MKRTKETYFRYHPDWMNREGMSGCREFDGEDLSDLFKFFTKIHAS
jgi:hypothetical protein